MEILNHKSDHQPTQELEASVKEYNKDLKEIDDAITVLDDKIEKTEEDLSDAKQVIEAAL